MISLGADSLGQNVNLHHASTSFLDLAPSQTTEPVAGVTPGNPLAQELTTSSPKVFSSVKKAKTPAPAPAKGNKENDLDLALLANPFASVCSLPLLFFFTLFHS